MYMYITLFNIHFHSLLPGCCGPAPASSPTVAVLLTEVTCGHTGAGVVAGLAWVQARCVVIAVVGLALQLGLNLAVMV